MQCTWAKVILWFWDLEQPVARPLKNDFSLFENRKKQKSWSNRKVWNCKTGQVTIRQELNKDWQIFKWKKNFAKAVSEMISVFSDTNFHPKTRTWTGNFPGSFTDSWIGESVTEIWNWILKILNHKAEFLFLNHFCQLSCRKNHLNQESLISIWLTLFYEHYYISDWLQQF